MSGLRAVETHVGDTKAGGALGRLVVVGAAGDLAIRFLFPGVARLLAAGVVPSSLELVAAVRPPHVDGLSARIGAGLERAGIDRSDAEVLLARIRPVVADAEDPGSLAAAIGPQPVAVYLAVPPGIVPAAVRSLGAIPLAPGSAVAVEKPIGEDLASAHALGRLLETALPGVAVHRVDHFLHHRLVDDMLAVRQGDPTIWDGRLLERVDIVWHEARALDGRAAGYDRVGALRDMLQSHLLQLLAVVAMPATDPRPPGAFAHARLAALRAVRAAPPARLARTSARGRYEAGSLHGTPVTAYDTLPGVDPERETETFASVVLELEAPGWHGVPIRLESGKAITPAAQYVRLVYQRGAGVRDGDRWRPTPSFIRFQLGTTRVVVGAPGGSPEGDGAGTGARSVALESPAQSLPASARIIRDLLARDDRRCVSQAEVEEAWRIVDAIRQGWSVARVPVRRYAAGSRGPLPGD